MGECLLVSLTTLFGVSAWLNFNGLFLELPLLIERLPEGLQLGTYIAVVRACVSSRRAV